MPTPNKGESKQDYLKRCTADVIFEGKDPDQAYAMCNVFWDDSKNQRSTLALSAPVEFKETGKKDKSRKFFITGYTGEPIDTWWGIVVFDIAGIQTKEKIPVLREHKRDRVVGHGKSWSDDSNFYVSGDFSKATKDATEVLDLADEGYPWQASVFIKPKKILVLESKKKSQVVNGKVITGPAEIWVETDVGEVSFVSLGRDNNTAAISFSEGEGKVPVNIERLTNNIDLEVKTMDLKELKEKHPGLLAQIQETASKEGEKIGFDKGVAKERGRVMEIMAADADQIETKKAIENGVASADAFKLFYQAEVKKRKLGLKGMEKESTQSIEGEELSAEELAKKGNEGELSIDQKLTKKAKELAEKKGITQAEAVTQLSKSEMDLRRQWKPALGPAA